MIKGNIPQNVTEETEQEQIEEEEYEPQHPMLEFKQQAVEVGEDHLNDYVEVNPFEKKETAQSETAIKE